MIPRYQKILLVLLLIASLGPGEAIVSGSKLCQQGDTTPFGTVKDGYRKTEISLPFGKTCLWDPVK